MACQITRFNRSFGNFPLKSKTQLCYSRFQYTPRQGISVSFQNSKRWISFSTQSKNGINLLSQSPSSRLMLKDLSGSSLFFQRKFHSSRMTLADEEEEDDIFDDFEPSFQKYLEPDEVIPDEMIETETFAEEEKIEAGEIEGEEVREDPPILAEPTVYSEKDEIEAKELSAEIKKLFGQFKDKSKPEIQGIFKEKILDFETLFQRVSMNPLLSRQLREMEKEIYHRAKSGETNAIQQWKEASELEKALDTFQPDTLYILEQFLPKVFRAFEHEQEGGVFKRERKSLMERLILHDGLIPPTLRKTIDELFYPNRKPDVDPFAELVSNFREEIPSTRTKFRRSLKTFKKKDFDDFYDKIRDKLAIIQKEVLAMEQARNVKLQQKEEEDWVLADPTDITPAAIGKYVSISSSRLSNLLPEGLGTLPMDEFYRSDESNLGLMVRRETAQLIESLKQGLANGFVKTSIPRFQIFTGERGCGKTSALNLVTYWARANGWIVVRINARSHTEDEHYVLKPSTTMKGFWDNHFESHVLCKQILAAHQDQLKELPIKEQFSIPGFDRTPGSTLADLIEFGAAKDQHQDHANTAIYYFRRELTYVTKYPVLIVLDEVNCFYNKSNTIFDPESVSTNFRAKGIIAANKLVTPHIFSNLSHGLLNGTIVGATTGIQRHQEFLKSNNLQEKDLIHLPNLSRNEVTTVLNWFGRTGVLAKPLNERTNEYIYLLTEGRGHDLLEYAKAN